MHAGNKVITQPAIIPRRLGGGGGGKRGGGHKLMTNATKVSRMQSMTHVLIGINGSVCNAYRKESAAQPPAPLQVITCLHG